mmetsp:Transcript_29990/g.54643  ORF Transcript_29990/g.54643 Transcript_29990/m.54643 type:complete len:529 (-) Transcript_29990:82-1668(-)
MWVLASMALALGSLPLSMAKWVSHDEELLHLARDTCGLHAISLNSHAQGIEHEHSFLQEKQRGSAKVHQKTGANKTRSTWKLDNEQDAVTIAKITSLVSTFLTGDEMTTVTELGEMGATREVRKKFLWQWWNHAHSVEKEVSYFSISAVTPDQKYNLIMHLLVAHGFAALAATRDEWNIDTYLDEAKKLASLTPSMYYPDPVMEDEDGYDEYLVKAKNAGRDAFLKMQEWIASYKGLTAKLDELPLHALRHLHEHDHIGKVTYYDDPPEFMKHEPGAWTKPDRADTRGDDATDNALFTDFQAQNSREAQKFLMQLLAKHEIAPASPPDDIGGFADWHARYEGIHIFRRKFEWQYMSHYIENTVRLRINYADDLFESWWDTRMHDFWERLIQSSDALITLSGQTSLRLVEEEMRTASGYFVEDLDAKDSPVKYWKIEGQTQFKAGEEVSYVPYIAAVLTKAQYLSLSSKGGDEQQEAMTQILQEQRDAYLLALHAAVTDAGFTMWDQYGGEFIDLFVKEFNWPFRQLSG